MPDKPLPIYENNEYNTKIEAVQALDPDKLSNIEEQYGFTYIQATGELLYAMITYRPDISFPLINLSQYSTGSALEHFVAIKFIYSYRKHTPDKYLYYWGKY